MNKRNDKEPNSPIYLWLTIPLILQEIQTLLAVRWSWIDNNYLKKKNI